VTAVRSLGSNPQRSTSPELYQRSGMICIKAKSDPVSDYSSI
jgi:hypothetical protein